MKNTNTGQAVTYLGAGALLAIIVLFLMGRLRTERYEEASEKELLDFLNMMESKASTGPAERQMM
jgi:hypothetical protein